MLTDAITAARRERALRFVCIEVDRLDQLDMVLGLDAGLVDIVLLDNMDCDTLVEAVAGVMRPVAASHLKHRVA